MMLEKLAFWRQRAKTYEKAQDLQMRKNLQKVYLSGGIFPNQFSIVLGAAPCIHACLFCPQSVKKLAQKLWLDLEVLEKVLLEMPEQGIMLNVSSYSETMLNPILFPSLKLMKNLRPGLPIVLATNGVSITEEQVNHLIDLRLDILQFSFDAPDQESYKIMMQNDHYDQAVKKLNMICKIRSQRNSDMKIYTHIMGFKCLEEKFKDFQTRWQDKVDAINFRQVGNWGSDGLQLKKQLAEKGFVPVYQPPVKRYPCTSIFMHFKLGPDGYYYPCVAYIPFTVEPGFSLGDARKVSFKTAWDRLEEMRHLHLNSRWDECPLCRNCDVWGLWENMFFEKKHQFYIDDKIKELNLWR